MKKLLALLLAAVMLLSVLSACSSSADAPADTQPAETETTEPTPEETTEETKEEEPAAEEPTQEELDQAAADEVAAMIDAIYVQTRTEETDAQCEAAKAAWDALTDEQKALVEGEEASPDYFGLDTGDASKDDPRNQDEIGENELLVVSFGTSFAVRFPNSFCRFPCGRSSRPSVRSSISARGSRRCSAESSPSPFWTRLR